MIKKLLRPYVPHVLINKLKKKFFTKDEYQNWQKAGCPIPTPHIAKQIIIQDYHKLYGNDVLVETGTFHGDMVEAQKNNFKKVISIELAVKLFKRAQKRFIKDNNVTIIQGDSGKVLIELMKSITEPAIFWLDGHYSAGITAKGNTECPIFEELDAILRSKFFNHVILIDDARFFIGKGDYPSIDKLTDFVKSKNDKYNVEVKNDIIRYTI
ncbi:MAG: hypothetical protein H7Z13_00940 [Ferruginibacter sp.]|nr:hypothetical protein [Ferruginibacter sp.]